MEFTAETSGERLDKFLAVHLAKFSRTHFQRLIKDGAIKVNRAIVKKPGLSLKKGDCVLILEEKVLSPDKEFIIEPEPDILLEIIYEDDNVAVINKQPNLIVHPTSSQRWHTLANALVARYPKIVGVGESPLRPGIVHRLDKDTSGLMVVAKNQEAFLELKNQFLKREIVKTYLAIVEGVPKPPEGCIQFQIRPSKANRLKKVAVRVLDTSGKKSVRAAETCYHLKEVINEDFSLVEAMPKTGRTHQIRVHLSAIGHPVAGDKMYGAKKKNDLPGGGQIKRQMLHAYKLVFTLPGGKRLNLEAPVPEDMKSVIKSLKYSHG